MEKEKLFTMDQIARELGLSEEELIEFSKAEGLLDENGRATQKGKDDGLLTEKISLDMKAIKIESLYGFVPIPGDDLNLKKVNISLDDLEKWWSYRKQHPDAEDIMEIDWGAVVYLTGPADAAPFTGEYIIKKTGENEYSVGKNVGGELTMQQYNGAFSDVLKFLLEDVNDIYHSI